MFILSYDKLIPNHVSAARSVDILGSFPLMYLSKPFKYHSEFMNLTLLDPPSDSSALYRFKHNCTTYIAENCLTLSEVLMLEISKSSRLSNLYMRILGYTCKHDQKRRFLLILHNKKGMVSSVWN